MNYYNEYDPYAAEWLRNLVAAGLIAPGDVDERSIEDVRPADLAGYTQCHFFAGIGGWPEALRLAGVPDDTPLWTGSCPCQPYSAAGARRGSDDPRNLWWAFRWLIDQCRPPAVLGEQVASRDGRTWLSGVRTDLEAMDYDVGAADLCAAGVGAPHIRQRLFFVAERLADADDARLEGRRKPGRERAGERLAGPGSVAGGLADAAVGGRREERPNRSGGVAGGRAERLAAGFGAGRGDLRPRPAHVDWRDADWLFCRDGRWRPVEPGTFPLAHGAPARVGRLRAYGNAIVPQAAAAFIAAWKEARCHS